MEEKAKNVPSETQTESQNTQKKESRFTKTEWSWIMYDWANSVFATIMMAVLFPIYFTGLAGDSGDVWWGYASSASTFIMAVLAPFVGAIGDRKNTKMKVFLIFWIIGMVGTTFCAVFTDWRLLFVTYIITAMGYAGSNLSYDSFLTDVTTEDRMDRVSSWGYAMGYIGGSTIPFLVAIALIMLSDRIGITYNTAIRISVVITVVWWFFFSIPFLRNVRQKYYNADTSEHFIRDTLRHVGQTAKAIFSQKKLLVFILAYFFYIDGVGTVIKMSTAYGTAIGLDSTGMILALLLTQLVAMPCSILFGRLGKKIGALKAIFSGICIYVVDCLLGFVMGLGLEEGFLTTSQAMVIFWTVAVLVGTSQGGIQALSRSYFGKIIPKEKSNEFFGFFEIFGKFAAVLGPFLYSTISAVTGRSSLAILSVISLFVAGGLILLFGRKYLEDV